MTLKMKINVQLKIFYHIHTEPLFRAWKKHLYARIYECLILQGKWKFRWFSMLINIFSIYANNCCDTGQVPIPK